jgi:chitinase
MVKSVSRAIVVSTLLIALPVSIVSAKTADLTKRIIGYYINWGMYGAHNGYGPQDVPWTKITHINYAFAEIVPGTWAIKGTDDWADIQCGPQQNGQIGQLNALKKQYGVKTMISVGGWTRSGQFSPMAATETGRAAFVSSCAQYIKKYGFDGVDIDWEYPCFVRDADPNLSGDQACHGTPADKGNYTLLLQKLRSTLDSAGKADQATYYLSVAAPGGYDKSEGPTTFQEPEKYHQYIDWMNVMSYDFHGGWDTLTNHLAALYPNPKDPSATAPVDIKNRYNADAIVKFYEAKGVPSSKINIGAAYYGRSWKSVPEGGSKGLYQHAVARDFYETVWNYGVEPFYTLKLWEGDPTYSYGYDEVAKVPYLYNSSAKLFYTYDNERSVGDKCDYAVSNRLGGVFFWEFTGDYPSKGATLTGVIYNKLSNVAVNERPVDHPAFDRSFSVRSSSKPGTLLFVNGSSRALALRLFDARGRIVGALTLNKGAIVMKSGFSVGVYLCSSDNGTVTTMAVRR